MSRQLTSIDTTTLSSQQSKGKWCKHTDNAEPLSIPPVNKDLLFSVPNDGPAQIETAHKKELEALQRYLSEKEIELICIYRSLSDERRKQVYNHAHRLYHIKHRVQSKMGHQPHLSERDAIDYIVDQSLGAA
ncbi:MAG: hypothetical protein GY874_06675 [Desulfobacteraceae bacterium]|nr:hypothetical protein [Desulfobacteraceae bacterium]